MFFFLLFGPGRPVVFARWGPQYRIEYKFFARWGPQYRIEYKCFYLFEKQQKGQKNTNKQLTISICVWVHPFYYIIDD